MYCFARPRTGTTPSLTYLIVQVAYLLECVYYMYFLCRCVVLFVLFHSLFPREVLIQSDDKSRREMRCKTRNTFRARAVCLGVTTKWPRTAQLSGTFFRLYSFMYSVRHSSKQKHRQQQMPWASCRTWAIFDGSGDQGNCSKQLTSLRPQTDHWNRERARKIRPYWRHSGTLIWRQCKKVAVRVRELARKHRLHCLS